MSGGLTLDAGALIAFGRGDERVRELIGGARRRDLRIHVPAGVYAQCWRGGARQAELARLMGLDDITVPALDSSAARAIGELCALSGHSDVIDAHVALDAREHDHVVVTSDPDDIARVDPGLELVVV